MTELPLIPVTYEKLPQYSLGEKFALVNATLADGAVACQIPKYDVYLPPTNTSGAPALLRYTPSRFLTTSNTAFSVPVSSTSESTITWAKTVMLYSAAGAPAASFSNPEPTPFVSGPFTYACKLSARGLVSDETLNAAATLVRVNYYVQGSDNIEIKNFVSSSYTPIPTTGVNASLDNVETMIYVDIPDGSVIYSIVAEHHLLFTVNSGVTPHNINADLVETVSLRDPILGNTLSDKGVFYVQGSIGEKNITISGAVNYQAVPMAKNLQLVKPEVFPQASFVPLEGALALYKYATHVRYVYTRADYATLCKMLGRQLNFTDLEVGLRDSPDSTTG